ncbi:MAG: glutamate--tRNA ligase [Rickettsiales bacterium]|jgi:glutamyl-tRNA synthetase|nr:glutamate--tRNA ligase [Rickettsiales bacterium]
MRKGLSESLIARVLGASPKWTIAELEKKFPPRNLPDGAMATRFAPSPTGFMHIGNLYGMLIDKKLAGQSGGVFFLRVEDTDTKREIKGAVDIVLKAAEKFNIIPDEGPQCDVISHARVKENYGPYYQSERKEIYHSVAAELLEKGKAYPCFLTAAEIDDIRTRQAAAGFATGIYGEWAKWRNADEDEITRKLDSGAIPSIRLYSLGNKDQRIFCKDEVRGSIAFPENDEDIVLIKSNDGLPTYHFAHLVDDHFMGTTHVVRSEEWLPSLTLHVQLFNMMGWAPPAYIHTSTLDTIDVETGKQRKLSKRKDQFANIAYFSKVGFPPEAVLEYLFNIMNSAYEEDKAKGKIKTVWDCDLKIKKIPTSGALFDMKKLEWWSKEFIAGLSVDDLTRRVVDWAKEFGSDNDRLMISDEKYLAAILGIERDDPKRIRKDFITWKQTLDEIAYFFDELFIPISEPVDKNILQKFLSSFDFKDGKDLWWEKITEIANGLGIKNGDAAMALRVALTGRAQTPDLYSIMQVMGGDRARGRIENAIKETK